VPSKPKSQSNRLNAQRSTGPKSTLGKHLASRNALRHGLSTPLDPQNPDPTFQSLVALLEAEDIPPPTAQQLAARILDYERNLAHERTLLIEQEAPPAFDEDDLHRTFPEIDMLKEHLDEARRARDKVSSRELRQALWLIGAMQRHFQQSRTRNLARERRNAPRYLKRASNQLIKALRQLA